MIDTYRHGCIYIRNASIRFSVFAMGHGSVCAAIGPVELVATGAMCSPLTISQEGEFFIAQGVYSCVVMVLLAASFLLVYSSYPCID